MKILQCALPWMLTLMLQSPSLAGQELTVMSFNTWHDWSKVDDGFAKAEAAIRQSGADVVGLQESSPATAARMAEKLGWQVASGATGSAQIISRFPIVESLSDRAPDHSRLIGARLRLENPEREVVVFNLHLDYVNYGPYEANKPGATPEKVLAENARSQRIPQITTFISAMKPWLEKSETVPVFLTGDFNVPSHLDWTDGNSQPHGGIGAVRWPESSRVAEAGFTDSFRSAHPDPVKEPGYTWSSIHKTPEPQDRIDFVYSMGSRAKIKSSMVFTTAVETTLLAWGVDTAPVKGNTWPSDHAAVMTTFALD